MANAQLRALLHHLRRLVGPRGDGGLTDADLLERFVSERDEAAFEVLVWRHGPMVLSVCRRVLRQEQDAEDAFQATFLTLVRKARSIAKRQAVASWLYKVAYRIALEAKTLASKRNMREKQDTGMLEATATQQPTDPAVWRDLRAVLDEEVSRLPDKYRTPLILCYFEGKTYEEAARELGCPKGTVSIRLLRARELLRPRLARRGLALSGGILAAVLSENATAAAVSQSLVEGTVKAAVLFAAGKAAAGVLSMQAVALTEGVLKTMFLTKLKIAAALLLVVGVTGTGAGVLTYRGMAGEQPAVQAESGSVAQQKEAQEARAKVPQRDVSDERKRKQAEADRTLELLQRARTELSDIENEYQRHEHRRIDALIPARLRLMEKEDRLRLVERALASQGEKEYANMQRQEEKVKILERSFSSQKTENLHTRLGEARNELREAQETFQRQEHTRTGQLFKVRTDFLTAQEEFRLLEQLQAFQRERDRRKLEAADERIRRLEEDSSRAEPAKQGPMELEKKVDRLLREVSELRREIRRQPTDKGQQPSPERRPDQP